MPAIPVPTVAQSQPSDWGTFAKQFLDHIKPAVEKVLEDGAALAESSIPGGFIIGMFIGPTLIDQWTSNAFDLVEGMIEKNASAIPKDGIVGFISNLALSLFASSDGDVLKFLQNDGHDVVAMIEAKVQEGIDAGRALFK